MSQAVITVAGIEPPGPGKKQGHIHDINGGKWNVWGDKLQNYRMGVTYDIQYETNEFNNKQFNVIKSANPSSTGQSGGHQPRPVPPKEGWPCPAPSGGTSAVQYIDQKAETIFVCGVVNNAMSNANVSPFEVTLTELIAMVDKARSAWRNTLGKSQRDPEMQDEIPL